MPTEPLSAPGTLTKLIEEVARTFHEDEDEWRTGLHPGAVFGKYRLEREIGRGGFGVVWAARDTELGRPVAFKALRVRGSDLRERRLLTEAEVAARLSHPNVVTILDAGRSDHGAYLVQELLTGETLERRLRAGRMGVRETVRLGLELAKGLAHAHANGVIHRDLTPRNVQLCDDGQVKLLDLGLASALGRRKAEGGTPYFMPPEQASGAPEDERTDVFALGAVLHQALLGTSASRPASLRSRASTPRGIDIPEAPGLDRLIEAMLASDPTQRPRDGGEVLAQLRSVAATLPAGLGDGPSRARALPAPRMRWMALGAALALLAAAALAAAALWLGTKPRPPTPAALVISPTSASTLCHWENVPTPAVSARPEGAIWRNGAFEGQETVEREGRPAWLQRSDWNQLFLPIPTSDLDFFAIEAAFLAPPVTAWRRSVTFMVFTDPADSDPSDVAHGRGIVLHQDPGRSPVLQWGVPAGKNSHRFSHTAALLAPFTGAWRLLRIEGSRSRCWTRAMVDGVPVVTATGDCDLAGRYTLLGSGGDTYRPGDVAWRDFRVFRGSPDCQ